MFVRQGVSKNFDPCFKLKWEKWQPFHEWVGTNEKLSEPLPIKFIFVTFLWKKKAAKSFEPGFRTKWERKVKWLTHADDPIGESARVVVQTLVAIPLQILIVELLPAHASLACFLCEN